MFDQLLQVGGLRLRADQDDVVDGDVCEKRGPDGRGHHIDRAAGVALGHTRLAINDLEGGCQPLHAVDGRHVLTTNGEFYDFKRHRSTLMAEGDRFLTKSDSEIAIGLYRKMGLNVERKTTM